MIKKYGTVLSLVCILLLSSCGKYKKYYNRQKLYLSKVFFAGPLPDGPVTLFIHGTKASVISKMVHKLDYPYGIVPASINRSGSVLDNIAHSLCHPGQTQFSFDAFYFYGWPGKLTFKSRLKAADRLYSVINNHEGPLTIITHSHGCNVALNLAYYAEINDNPSFAIDRLILLAPPVQEVTKLYAQSPVFKEIYTFYSTADIMQIGDAQGLYWESYAFTPPCTRIPFFSQRTFDPSPHIIQTRILLDWQSPGHLHFMLSRFIKQIPEILTLVKNAAATTDFEKTHNHFIVNIPLCGLPPHLVDPREIKRRYTPRSNYYATKRRVKQQRLSPASATLPELSKPGRI
jgi:hypothetical protein